MHATNTLVCTYAGRQIHDNRYEETQFQHESVPQDLVIPNSQIRLLESIGQGELYSVNIRVGLIALKHLSGSLAPLV